MSNSIHKWILLPDWPFRCCEHNAKTTGITPNTGFSRCIKEKWGSNYAPLLNVLSQAHPPKYPILYPSPIFQHFPSPRKFHLAWPCEGEWSAEPLRGSWGWHVACWRFSQKATSTWSQVHILYIVLWQWPREMQRGNNNGLTQGPISQWGKWKVIVHLSVTNQRKQARKVRASAWPPLTSCGCFSSVLKTFLQTGRDSPPLALVKLCAIPRHTHLHISAPLFTPIPSPRRPPFCQNPSKPSSKVNASTRKPKWHCFNQERLFFPHIKLCGRKQLWAGLGIPQSSRIQSPAILLLHCPWHMAPPRPSHPLPAAKPKGCSSSEGPLKDNHPTTSSFLSLATPIGKCRFSTGHVPQLLFLWRKEHGYQMANWTVLPASTSSHFLVIQHTYFNFFPSLGQGPHRWHCG